MKLENYKTLNKNSKIVVTVLFKKVISQFNFVSAKNGDK